LETINSALTSYAEEFEKLNKDIAVIQKSITALNNFLKDAIESMEYSGNTQMTDDIENKMTDVKNKIFKLE